ncbi:MAG: hypothetical protein H0U95_11575 [Bacteroidetes bacterium]|nr:hypothetical protein [Bacteroidota bacterium]
MISIMLKTNNFKFLICLSVFFLSAFTHPYYLGVTDLVYNVKEKNLQGSVKLFTNDLEGALKKAHNNTIDLINVKNKEAVTIILSDYLKKHFELKVNDKKTSYKLIGFEREEESVLMYIEFEKTETPKEVDVDNTLLYDHLKEQINIVEIEVNNSKKSLKCTNPEKSFKFQFLDQ